MNVPKQKRGSTSDRNSYSYGHVALEASVRRLKVISLENSFAY